MARILIIDDEDALRGALRLALEQVGHEVAEAGNGEQGLTSFAQEPADLVLTDIVMPEREGLETILELRKRHGLKKIIAMSGGGYMDPVAYLHIAQQMGAARVLRKPFRMQELQEAVAAVLAAP